MNADVSARRRQMALMAQQLSGVRRSARARVITKRGLKTGWNEHKKARVAMNALHASQHERINAKTFYFRKKPFAESKANAAPRLSEIAASKHDEEEVTRFRFKAI